MEDIEIDVRSKVIAATFLLRLALNVLKSGGSDDPEEQPERLISNVMQTLDGVANDLADVSEMLSLVTQQLKWMLVVYTRY